MTHSLVARLAVLFVLTGAGGLLAEQVFEKLLTTLVGASTPAGAMVLAAYFAGLTLGAWLFARRAPQHGLRLYALLELGIAAWALLLRVGGGHLAAALVPLLQLGEGHFWLLQLLRGVAACVWILPPTMLMGASFPAVVSALERWNAQSPRRLLTGFYGLNLLGALAGAVLGPTVLFPRLGLDGALVVIALVDGTAGLLAWATLRPPPEVAALAPKSAPEAGAGAVHPGLLGLAFGSGFVFFALEVLWTHLISVTMGNSVYAFAATLATVLLGLLVGGAVASRRWPETARPTPAVLAGILISAELALAFQFTLWDRVPSFFILAALWANARGAPITSFAESELYRWGFAALLIVPPAALLGLVYPMLFRLGLFPDAGRGPLAARLGAWNSVGCVLGALVCGFGLIPWLGSEGTLRLVIAALGVAATWLSARWLLGRERVTLLVVAVGAVALGLALPRWDRLALTNGGHVYFKAAFVDRGSTLDFFHEDTQGGITTVVTNRHADGSVHRTLLTNGKFQANDDLETAAQVGFASVALLHAARADDALVIGLGSGNTAGIVHQAGVARLDVAEISRGIVEAARSHFRALNGGVLDAPGTTLFLEDGRNHLLLNPKSYDLITMELTSVWFAGASMLYSREFYELARSHLRPGGVLQQWIQLHHIGPAELTAVMRSMREVFGAVSLWVVGEQGILIATVGPQGPAPTAFERLARLPGTSEAWTAGLLATRLLAPADLEAWLAANPTPANTDANRFLEYATPRYNLDPRDLFQSNLEALGRFSTFPPFDTAGWPAGLAASVGAQTVADKRRAMGLD